MRIVTWNALKGDCRQRAAALVRLAPELACVQGVDAPEEPSDDCIYYNPATGDPATGDLAGDPAAGNAGAGGPPSQGQAIFTAGRHRIDAAATVGPGSAVYPVVVRGKDDCRLLAVWARPEPSFVGSVLEGLRACAPFLQQAPAVVAGDFTSTAAWAQDDPAANHEALVAALAELGLVSAYHTFYDEAMGYESRPTYYHEGRKDAAFHTSYVFLPAAWREKVSAVTVGAWSTWNVEGFHMPLAVTVEP